MTTDTRTEKLADLTIEHGWLDRYDVPDSRPASWDPGDWHCKCGWFGNHGWSGYAYHLESVVNAVRDSR